jgi:hypothetical protein
MREQQMKALERANLVRLAAADVKREVSSGILPLRDAVFDERAQSIVLRTLLMTPSRVGPVRVDRLLRRLEINGHKRVSDLTERQKGVVADAA